MCAKFFKEIGNQKNTKRKQGKLQIGYVLNPQTNCLKLEN